MFNCDFKYQENALIFSSKMIVLSYDTRLQSFINLWGIVPLVIFVIFHAQQIVNLYRVIFNERR